MGPRVKPGDAEKKISPPLRAVLFSDRVFGAGARRITSVWKRSSSSPEMRKGRARDTASFERIKPFQIGLGKV